MDVIGFGTVSESSRLIQPFASPDSVRSSSRNETIGSEIGGEAESQAGPGFLPVNGMSGTIRAEVPLLLHTPMKPFGSGEVALCGVGETVATIEEGKVREISLQVRVPINKHLSICHQTRM